jgi:hypothetical protein
MWRCDIGCIVPNIAAEYQDQFAQCKSITSQKNLNLQHQSYEIFKSRKNASYLHATGALKIAGIYSHSELKDLRRKIYVMSVLR